MLHDGEQCVCDLQEALDAAQSRLSFHLKVLRESGLVTDRKEGRWSYYTLVPEALAEVHDLVVGLVPSARRVRGGVPAAVRRSMELWVGCVAGALEEREFTALLTEVGFEHADIEPTRVYRSEDARVFLEGAGVAVDEHLHEIDGRFMAAFVRATKPRTTACCGPDGCA